MKTASLKAVEKLPYEKKFKRVSIGKAVSVSEGMFEIYIETYWVVTKENEILYYTVGGCMSPQANKDRSLAEGIRDVLHPGKDVRYLPAVYRKLDPKDQLRLKKGR